MPLKPGVKNASPAKRERDAMPEARVVVNAVPGAMSDVMKRPPLRPFKRAFKMKDRGMHLRCAMSASTLQPPRLGLSQTPTRTQR
jgi:hypothetical protein